MFNLDANKLKWIAMVGMVLNHAVIALREIIPFWLQLPLFAAGGVTFPILAYFITEGLKHTSSLKKYIGRILIFGLIAQPFHLLAFRAPIFNIMFTIALGIALIILHGKIKIRWLFWVTFVVAALVTVLFDWGIIGVIVMLMYHVISKESKRRTLPPIIAGGYNFVFSLLMIVLVSVAAASPELQAIITEMLTDKGMDTNMLWVNLGFSVGVLFSIFLLRGYNGQRGKPTNKYLFYIAYPVHLLILGGIAFALGLTDFASALGL